MEGECLVEPIVRDHLPYVVVKDAPGAVISVRSKSSRPSKQKISCFNTSQVAAAGWRSTSDRHRSDSGYEEPVPRIEQLTL